MQPQDELGENQETVATSPDGLKHAALDRSEPPAKLGIVEQAVLAIGWLSCVVLAWVPLLVGAALLGCLIILTAASYSLLRTGAFAVRDDRFADFCAFGLVAALVVMVGTLLRRLVRLQRRNVCVTGPTGQVWRVLLRREPDEKQGFLSWVPDMPALLLVTLLLVGVRIWLFRHPDASVGAITFIIATLMVLGIYWPTAVLWFGGKLAWALHRFARTGRYSAGFVSALLLMGGIYFGVSWVRVVHWAEGEVSMALSRTDVDVSVSDSAPSAAPRVLLFSLAEAFWPEQATEAGVRHLVAPLLARTSVVAPDDLAFLGWDGLAQYAQYGGFVSADEAAPPAFKLCIEKLYPAQVSRVKHLPSFRQYRLDDDSEHDALLGAVLEICQNHALRRPYDNLVQVLETAAVHAAIDIKRHHKRLVLSDDGGGSADFCPSPHDAPDRRLSAEQELARVKWSELRSVQKAIVIEKAVLELTDEEIAANHSPMTKEKVKDTYQNAIKKIRAKLLTSCPADPW